MDTLPKFILGQRVRDITTGFEGLATSRVEYLNGCVQYLVKPKCITKDGEPMKQPEGSYIDDQSLELVDDGILGVRPVGDHLSDLERSLGRPEDSVTGRMAAIGVDAFNSRGEHKTPWKDPRFAAEGDRESTGGPDAPEGDLPT